MYTVYEDENALDWAVEDWRAIAIAKCSAQYIDAGHIQVAGSDGIVVFDNLSQNQPLLPFRVISQR
jgi:hypothetical protein